jgi:hypothetical protein
MGAKLTKTLRFCYVKNRDEDLSQASQLPRPITYDSKRLGSTKGFRIVNEQNMVSAVRR